MRYSIWFGHTSSVFCADMASAKKIIRQQARQIGTRNPRLFSMLVDGNGKFVYLSNKLRKEDCDGRDAFAVIQKVSK